MRTLVLLIFTLVATYLFAQNVAQRTSQNPVSLTSSPTPNLIQGQLPPPVRSSSGQFVVYGDQQIRPLPPAFAGPAFENWVRLTPSTTAIACERVKQAMLWQLGAPDQWSGKFYVMLCSAVSPDQVIQIVSGKIADKWYYQIEIPEVIDPDRFVRTTVHVLLLEWINRKTQEQIYPPSWLVEGLSELIIADSGLEKLVPAMSMAPQFDLPISSITRQGPKPHVLAKAHAFFSTNRVFSLAELITPQPTNLIGSDALAFRHSSQLLVYELLQLRGGSVALCAYLDRFAFYRDPVEALLAALNQYFTSFKEMEQWWLLKTSAFQFRDLAARYNTPDALEKLRQIMLVQVLDDQATNSTPQWRIVSLQNLIINWTNQPQEELVKLKLAQLEALRWRVTPEVGSLIQQYQETLRSMLTRIQKEAQANQHNPTAAKIAISRIVRATARELDNLDEKRARMANTAAPTVEKGATNQTTQPALPRRQ